MRSAPKLILAFLSLYLLFSVGLVYFIYHSSTRTVERVAIHRLEDIAFSAMDEIDRLLFEKITDVETIASW